MIRKARTTDAREINRLIKTFAEQGVMLHRPIFQLYENIRDFYVYEENGEIVGCCALGIFWEDLGEIKALAVRQDHQKKGIGQQLVEICMQEAKDIGLKKVFALTYLDKFFANYGFTIIDKGELPQKIWSECVKCPKFPDCDEICMIKELY